MPDPHRQDPAVPDARAAGRLCALATETQRRVEDWSQQFPGLLGQPYIAPVTSAFAFAYPWCTSGDLLPPLAFELWIFAVDKVIDDDLASASEVEKFVHQLTTTATTGAPTGGSVHEHALVNLLDHLAGADLWPALRQRWLALFETTFTGMLTERLDIERIQASATLTFDDYVANSDSCAFRLIRLATWILSEDQQVLDHLETLMTAAWFGQVSSRLTNDLATCHREHPEHDLNATQITSPAAIRATVRDADQRSQDLLGPLLDAAVRPAIGLDRILAFGNGFYETTDFRPASDSEAR